MIDYLLSELEDLPSLYSAESTTASANCPAHCVCRHQLVSMAAQTPGNASVRHTVTAVTTSTEGENSSWLLCLIAVTHTRVFLHVHTLSRVDGAWCLSRSWFLTAARRIAKNLIDLVNVFSLTPPVEEKRGESEGRRVRVA